MPCKSATVPAAVILTLFIQSIAFNINPLFASPANGKELKVKKVRRPATIINIQKLSGQKQGNCLSQKTYLLNFPSSLRVLIVTGQPVFINQLFVMFN